MPKRVRVLPRNDSDDEFADINEEAILESSRDAKRERRREQYRRASAKKRRSVKKKRAKEAQDAPDTAPETPDKPKSTRINWGKSPHKERLTYYKAQRRRQTSIFPCPEECSSIVHPLRWCAKTL
jgi:hypothetical protein